MSTHPILFKLIMKLHHNFKVKLNVGKEEETSLYRCGVRQVDNLSGTIFIMVYQINAIEIKKIPENSIAIPQMYKTKNRKRIRIRK